MERKWTLRFRKSILGWVLISARPDHGQTLLGNDIPPHVHDYCLANERGIIIDEEAIMIIEAGQLIHKLTDANRYESRITRKIPDPSPASKYGEPPILDWDEAEYMGDENDGVYYGALFHNKTWWALATVDSDTGGFVDSLLHEPGYKSEKAAIAVAKNATMDWCYTNEINVETPSLENK